MLGPEAILDVRVVGGNKLTRKKPQGNRRFTSANVADNRLPNEYSGKGERWECDRNFEIMGSQF